jgi:hypothetical protein
MEKKHTPDENQKSLKNEAFLVITHQYNPNIEA